MQVFSTYEKNVNVSYNQANSVIVKNALNVNIMHNIFRLRDTEVVTRLTQRVPLVEQELLTLPQHPSSPPVFSGFVLLDI